MGNISLSPTQCLHCFCGRIERGICQKCRMIYTQRYIKPKLQKSTLVLPKYREVLEDGKGHRRHD